MYFSTQLLKHLSLLMTVRIYSYVVNSKSGSVSWKMNSLIYFVHITIFKLETLTVSEDTQHEQEYARISKRG